MAKMYVSVDKVRVGRRGLDRKTGAGADTGVGAYTEMGETPGKQKLSGRSRLWGGGQIGLRRTLQLGRIVQTLTLG